MAMSVVSVGVVEVIEALAGLVGDLDVAGLSGGEAAELTGVLARGERLCAAAKAMTARRASQAGQWAQAGHRDEEAWLAQVSGSSAGAARAALAVAQQMDAQPELARACRAGRLSAVQAGEIAAATAVDPGCAPGLIDAAGRESLARLRDSCRQVVMAGHSPADDTARRAALHQGRYLRTWTDRDGAGRLDARLTPEGLARFQACLHPFQTEQFHAARRAGRREKPQCYAADALLALAGHAAAHPTNTPATGPARSEPAQPGSAQPGSGDAAGAGAARRAGPPTTVVALVDHAALVRGHIQDQECCVIQGIGPVPVATVRALLDDAFLAAVVTDGIDIRSVVHIGRRPTAAQWTALWVRDRACVVTGCGVATGLEAHHLTGWSATKTTCLDDLALLCSHHHDLASYQGWTLTGPPGQWAWHPPPNPTPPGPFDDDGLHLHTPPPHTLTSHNDEPPNPDPHPLGLFGP